VRMSVQFAWRFLGRMMMSFLTATGLRIGNVRNKRTANRKVPVPAGSAASGYLCLLIQNSVEKFQERYNVVTKIEPSLFAY